MGRPQGTKNVMRTAEEKRKIVEEYLSGGISTWKIAEKYGTTQPMFRVWKKKYEENGVEGLKSKTGKKSGIGKGRSKKATTEVEQLKLELLKKEIEVARLKKGYQVKGVGAKKEYITTFEKNMK